MAEMTGTCLCGGVRYAINGPLRPVIFCHCEQCRRSSGHHVAATACRAGDLAFTADETLTWYRSSTVAERGFCRRCGGNLFYRSRGREYVSVMAGSLDTPTGLRAIAHIFVDRKSDYYVVDDRLPAHKGRGDIDLTGP